MITIPEGAALDHALIDPVTWADETRIHAYLTSSGRTTRYVK